MLVSKRIKISVYILLASLAVSTQEIVLKAAGNHFDPFLFTFIRFFIAAVVILIAARFFSNNNARPNWRDAAYRLLALNGFLFVVVGMILFQLAVNETKAGIVAVLFSCNPVFTLGLSFFIFKERLSLFSLLAIIGSLLGMLIVVNPANLTEPLGISFAIGSAVIFSIYSIFSRKIGERTGLSSLQITGLTFLFGSIELYLLLIASQLLSFIPSLAHLPFAQPFLHIPLLLSFHWSDLPILLFSGIFNTALGFVFYFLILQTAGTTLATTQFFVKPALAPLLSFFFLNEPLTPPLLLGIFLILLSALALIYSNYRFQYSKRS